MSVHIEWDNEERTAVLWSFIGRWTWGEFEETVITMTKMAESVSQQIDLIVDVRQMSILPADVVSRVKLKYLNRSMKIRHILTVGVDANLQLFWNTFTDLPYANQLKVRYFDTLEDARAFSQTDQ